MHARNTSILQIYEKIGKMSLKNEPFWKIMSFHKSFCMHLFKRFKTFLKLLVKVKSFVKKLKKKSILMTKLQNIFKRFQNFYETFRSIFVRTVPFQTKKLSRSNIFEISFVPSEIYLI